MTTTTTFQGMDPGAKSSSRVLRPPGGASNISFGTDDDAPSQRKNKMVSNIFAGPDDPHAHRRGNPPTGLPTGTLCGEPSAPLRRVQQPLLFPKNNEPELTTIHNSGAAMVWHQRQEAEAEVKRQEAEADAEVKRQEADADAENENGQANDECPEDVEAEQEEQETPPPQPSAPSGAANATTNAGGRRNPPGGKSSLILG